MVITDGRRLSGMTVRIVSQICSLQNPTPIHCILRERRVIQVWLLSPYPWWMGLLGSW